MLIIFVNYIVLFFLGFFSADISGQLIASRLERLPVYSEKKPVEKASVRTSLLDQKANVLSRNIFNSNPPVNEPVPLFDDAGTDGASGEALPVKGDDLRNTVDEKKKNAKPTTLRVKLLGTIVGDGTTYVAIIEDPKKRTQALYRLNDSVQEGVRIADIERNRIYIIHDGRMEWLDIYGKPSAGKKKKRRTPARIVETVAQETGRELSMILDRRELDEALSNVPQLLTKARIVPSFKNGKNEGFKIFSIVPGSIFEKVGLRNGDILVRINEMEIRDPQKFMGVFQQLKDETTLSLDLVRKGTRQTISYEIR